MFTKLRAIVALTALSVSATAALAGDITVTDAYARSASPAAKTGAAFLVIENSGPSDRLVGVASPAAARVELHTHIEEDGIMKMRHVEEGFALPEGGRIAMSRGGDHVMFMGLTNPFEQGNTVPLTLMFETAGKMEIEVPVDLTRMPTGGGHSN
ncbi:copper chaperone PCu(A)C [Roseovarius aestuariivivens]|uniref:copper chaperone PCu(A)C n=1 Tax=Roseovarius aestuariivivens TaxID=1888910 RepID=UPI001081FE33|nr:copper chaperone PCu(A)C [Roseovarius aestuariivivens]